MRVSIGSQKVEPRAVFDRIFRPPSGGASNRSVMDAVLEDAKALRRTASATDQVRLDEYFESIRALERGSSSRSSVRPGWARTRR
ncbi:MAG: DUF1552 domain-containing protein [Acidobacteria bacterium]|nr:DUF1552 domain-containing protein [Acidobacteriota bacterium]